jgi:CheY-like chemotaxis protein
MLAAPRTLFRVLVVQGNPITRELLVHLLRIGGYDVLSAGTGERAFVTMREWRGRIDCLFTEITLPGLVDGWIVADEFRQSNPLRPVICASDIDADCGRRMPNAAFVRKPVSPLDVLERVKRMTEPVVEADAPAWPEPPVAAIAS